MLKQSEVVTIKNQEYQIEIQSDLATELRLKVVHLETQQMFSNVFSKEFLEQLTQKTGNFKKLNIFLEMLSQCLNNSNTSLSFDMAEIQNKTYLILIYSIQFDRFVMVNIRVFYPLPLLKQQDLHIQIQTLRHKNEEMAVENLKLKEKIENVKNGLLEGTPIDSLLVICH